MISIIICSRDEKALASVSANIRETIGVDFEIIPILNSSGTIGICKAYNMGADQAQYDYICFVHEDVCFETRDWGMKIIRHLSNPEVGLIGLAGGDTKSLVPSSWSTILYHSEISIVQHFKSTGSFQRIFRTRDLEDKSIIKPVVCIDGVFMCTRRDVLNKYRFDEQTFSEFHGYDLDFSLQVGQSYKVCVIFDLVLHHFSEGSFNGQWLHYTMKLSEKWKKNLPQSVRQLDRQQLVTQHWTSMRNFLGKQIECGFSLPAILKNYFRYSFTPYFHFRHFLHFLRIILFVKVARSEQALEKLSG